MLLSTTHLHSDTEKALLLLTAQGDVQAYTALFQQYRSRVYYHALSFLKSPQHAEELVTDIFVKVWNQREKLAGVESFPNWLFVLGRNQLLTELRKKILHTSDIAAETNHLPDDLMLPDRQVELRETYQVIMQGVAQLPAQQKTAFTLSRLEGLSYEEVAQQMGISKRTVRFHIVMALNALREHARENGIYHANLLILLLLARY